MRIKSCYVPKSQLISFNLLVSSMLGMCVLNIAFERLKVRNVAKTLLVTLDGVFALLKLFFNLLGEIRLGDNDIIDLKHHSFSYHCFSHVISSTYSKLLNRTRAFNVTKSSLESLEFDINLLNSAGSLLNL